MFCLFTLLIWILSFVDCINYHHTCIVQCKTLWQAMTSWKEILQTDLETTIFKCYTTNLFNKFFLIIAWQWSFCASFNFHSFTWTFFRAFIFLLSSRITLHFSTLFILCCGSTSEHMNFSLVLTVVSDEQEACWKVSIIYTATFKWSFSMFDHQMNCLSSDAPETKISYSK